MKLNSKWKKRKMKLMLLLKGKKRRRPPDERLTVENSELVLKPDFFTS